MTQISTAEEQNTPVSKEQVIESLAGIEKSAGFLIRIAELAVFKEMYDRSKSSEITVVEFTVLRAIGLNPGLRQGVLADVLYIKWPSMTKLISSLELRRLIKREIPSHNRRSIELHLTDEGKALVEQYEPVFKQTESDIFSMLSDEEYQQLEVLLRKVSGWTEC
jgi:DNA-binding MarR family transcriptional regulator